MRFPWFGSCWLVSVCVLAAIGCGSGTDSGDVHLHAPELKTIVLVSVDTWRRDANGFLGDRTPSPTPFLDKVASQALVGADAVTPVPLTGPSHWSMLSGRWPWRDGLRVNGDRPGRVDGVPILPEILGENGWRTAAFVSCAVLSQRFGFSVGFDHFDDQFPVVGGLRNAEMAERRGDATVQAVLKWLKGQDPNQRVFVWVHLFDPHFPYAAPGGPLPGEHGDYLAEVAFADRQLEFLAKGFERLGRPLDESLWVVLGDHGEGLGAHHEGSHGLLLHGATTRIPFLIAGSAVRPGRVEGLVSTVDIVPTVLGQLGLTPTQTDGVDLLRDSPRSSRAIPLESMMGARSFGLASVVGLRDSNWLWEASPADHLWDLRTDPEEQRDLGRTRTEQVAKLRARRKKIGIPDLTAPLVQDRETVAQLRALGYFSSANRAGTGDVRAFVQDGLSWFNAIETNLHQGNYTEAERFVRKCIDRYPDSIDLWVNAGFAAVGLGNMREAEGRFRHAVSLNPDYPPARLNLANILFQQNRLNEAETEYRSLLEQDPKDLFALNNLGRLLVQEGRPDEAAPFFRSFVEFYPTHPQVRKIQKMLQEWARKKSEGTEKP